MLEVKNRIKLIKKKQKIAKRDQSGILSLGSKSFKRVLLTVFIAYLPLNGIQAHTIGAKNSKLKPAQTEYHCKKTDETIVIDGKLDENIWRQTPSVKFYGIVDGSKPPFITLGKIIWDEDYLYFGFYLERPDITCNWTKHDKAMGKAVAKDVFSKRPGAKLNTEIWGQGECMIMKIDSFAKIFLDPDGDGSNYLEFHINPANNVFDAWYKQGFDPGRRKRDRFPRIDWKCPGLLTATHIDGTLNNSSDVDRGWGIEVAIPWKALKPFTRGACPPKNGDIWGVHTGRVYRDRQGGRNKYWVFPFLEVWNCHFPDRYAKLIFQDNVPKFERFFAFSVTPDKRLIRKAADIGVTDVTGNYSEKLARLCKKYGLKFYPIVKVSLGECRKYFADKKIPCQKMTPEQEAMQKLLKGKKVHQASGNEYATTPKTPDNWQLTEEQKKLLAKMTKKNILIQDEYQFGGEPLKERITRKYHQEVLMQDLPCFHYPEVLQAFKDKIKKVMSHPDITGISFDYIGYENYYDCQCEQSKKLYHEYCKKNNIKPSDKIWQKFCLKTLVDFNNALVDYVHELNPKAKTFNHIYPVYLPEPLYGNRLKMDYCGQTAAWYFYWDPLKIEQYSGTIAKKQNKYWPGVHGVAFIGYYDSLKHNLLFPLKTPEKIECELRAILKGGSRMLMVCGLPDVINNPNVARVFKKFMKNRKEIK